MTDRSVPFTLGKGTCLRYDRADIKAMENALGIGFPHFTREGIWGSLTSTEIYIWRGLRAEDEKGELVHVFPLNDAGKDQAGDLIMEYLQEHTPAEMNDAIIKAFVAAGISRWKTKEEKEDDAPKQEIALKNSTT